MNKQEARPKVFENGRKKFQRVGWIETQRSKLGPIFSNKVQNISIIQVFSNGFEKQQYRNSQ